MLISSSLLRPTTATQQVDDALTARPRRGGVLVLRAAVGLAGVAAVFAWLHHSSRPSLSVNNDTSQTLEVQVCPAQECGGSVDEVEAHQRRTSRLRSEPVPLTPDSLRITAGGRLVGCLLIHRDPPAPEHVSVNLSEADLPTCRG